MSLAEYGKWFQFYALEPFLPERVDLAGALVTTTLANINRGKNGKVREISDFMLVQNILKQRVMDSDKKEAAHLMATMAMLGGKSR